LCTADGSGVWFEPYCGADTRVEDQGLGQGPNVVLELIEKAGLTAGSELFFDNLFTSFPLLTRLSEMEIAGTGTVRQNRLHRVPIISKKDLEKKSTTRGMADVLYQGDKVLVGWRDNKVRLLFRKLTYCLLNAIVHYSIYVFSCQVCFFLTGCLYGVQQVRWGDHDHLPPLQPGREEEYPGII
jgi:hypothetical protein